MAAQFEIQQEVAHGYLGSTEQNPLPPSSLFHRLVYVLRHSWMLRITLPISVAALFLAAFGPTISPISLVSATSAVDVPPSLNHLFGTDPSGLDVFWRVLAAPRIDVTIAIASTLLSVVIGSMIGLVTSFFRGPAAEFVMRTSDLVQAFPLFVLAIIFVVMTGRSYANIILIISLLNIPIYLRLIRSEVLSLRTRTFVEAAYANGDHGLSIAFRHVLPNAIAPALAQAPVTLGYSILVIAGLSFIGAGVQPPTPEWGSMIATGANGIIIGQWWPSVFPGVVLSITVFSFAAMGEALQTAVFRR